MVVTVESEVVSRAQSGDRAAFGILYDTYLPKIYDFALGMLRNRADAEDVTSETFLKCVERLRTLKDPEAFRGWLYTIARNSALTLIESRKRAVPTAEHDEAATGIAADAILDPEARAESDELRDLVWDAAATLNPRDHQVFELTVRHGLSSAEIAPMLDVRPAYAYILVNRLKGSVEEALETVLLTRTGRGDCAELDRIVTVYGEDATPRLRKAVARHAKACAACGRTKRTRASVPALLAGMAFAAPSTAFAAELAAKIDRAWPPAPPSGGAGSGGGALSNIVGAGLVVAALSFGTIGVTAQRTIEPNDDIVEVAPAVEEKESDEPKESEPPTEPPVRRREPSGPQEPSAPDPQPRNTPIVVVIDGTSGGQGDVEVNNDSDNDEPPKTPPPRQTEPPAEDPPPDKPGSQPPVG